MKAYKFNSSIYNIMPYFSILTFISSKFCKYRKIFAIELFWSDEKYVDTFTNLFMHKTALWLIFFIISSYSFILNSLPANEVDAMRMIENGELDSSLWYLVEPFYNQPLSVPYGELDNLMENFPKLSLELPITDLALSKYLPWEKKNIEEFFDDWPELYAFRPILDFSWSAPVKIGNAGFFVNKNMEQKKSSQYFQFALKPIMFLNVNGRLNISENCLRWKNRRIKIIPTRWCELNAGNVKPVEDHGLITGIFGKEKIQDNSVLSNWLYGDVGRWNSIITQFSFNLDRKKITLQPFVHKRISESIAGVSGRFEIIGKMSNEFSIIALNASEREDTLVYMMYGLKLDANDYGLQMITCTPMKDIPVLPVSLKCRYKRENDEFKAEVVYIPQGYEGPRSMAISSIENVEITKDLVGSDLLNTECLFKHSFSSKLSLSPIVKIVFYDYTIASIFTGAQMKGLINNIRYQLYYRWYINQFKDSEKIIHEYLCSLTSSEYKKIDIGIDFKSRYYTDNSITYCGEITTGLKINTSLTVRSFLAYNWHYFSGDKISIGISKRMTLYESTYTEVSVENDLIKFSKWSSLRVLAKMWFLF